MKNWVVLLFCLLLAACVSAPPAPRADNLFNDQLFAAPSQRISADDVFALSPDMLQYLHNDEFISQMREKGQQQGLFDALYNKTQLKLDYNSERTRNAAQTFAARSGNCLSLVIMTAAFAKHLRLPIEYQTVLIEQSWTRNDNIYFASGHVNITLGKRLSDARTRYDQSSLLTIDFLPPEDIDGQNRRDIGESTVVAMYMNNQAAEALAAHRQNDAYWWAREAIHQDPAFLASYNTLGVIYRRHGNPQEAERAFSQVLESEPANTVVMFNLIDVLNELGQTARAKALGARLAQLQPVAPFQAFNLGMAAMQAGDYQTAKLQFSREIARDPYYHEFQYWMGIACLRLGEIDQAVQHLSVAMESSTTRSDHDLYAAKLDRVKSYRAPLLVH